MSRLGRWIGGKLLGLDPDVVQRLVDIDRTSPRALSRRIDELSEDLDYVRADVAKLRGRVVGGVRKPKEEIPDVLVVGEGEPEPDPEIFEEVTDQYTRRTLIGGKSDGSPSA